MEFLALRPAVSTRIRSSPANFSGSLHVWCNYYLDGDLGNGGMVRLLHGTNAIGVNGNHPHTLLFGQDKMGQFGQSCCLPTPVGPVELKFYRSRQFP